ncbi:SDR family NAD(P)-dependent oxidoreductase [Conexibacter sp. JD483]|uniref:SDR family NAD(P)-dependent oxidoreductase n=1 Tax=unclassified Conexibacter TaxID=2627773 RepID=UPI00271D796A|nr:MULTISPECIES: SDR family NAD(P)-dependent oxidoreductase [unclassified Conexibacter]MDO8187062.1 SDR family NAD(P)-dependent oxidoreductase [Conexibacter sp. CPCC 205706]MDO8200920.1 SDR family NAD(P)-dependent oxidoreductase [Conexibacter sp. CPCC 205762]MDR9371302.1 SDR family NAD(P)-dependent oxidoreductase [Conexibacter sp. JD483]
MSWDLGAGLDGRVALVTGASGAIGRHVAAALAAAGARVVAVDLDEAAVRAVVAGLPGNGERHVALSADLRDLDAIEQLVQRAVAATGRLDVLAHVAGVIKRVADLDDVTPADWELQEQVNLRATFFLGRACARAMRAGGEGGAIVNFTSQGWQSGGFGGSAVYAATKGGVVSLSRGMARTFAADGIRVNCVAPGMVESPMLRNGLPAAQIDGFVDQIPLGRFARPEELAGAVVFLASQHATYITGATLDVSGGLLMY